MLKAEVRPQKKRNQFVRMVKTGEPHNKQLGAPNITTTSSDVRPKPTQLIHLSRMVPTGDCTGGPAPANGCQRKLQLPLQLQLQLPLQSQNQSQSRTQSHRPTSKTFSRL